MASRKEFPESKFSASEMRRLGDPAAGMFDATTPDGLPAGQAALVSTGMTVKRAMDYVNAVKEGRIDPKSDAAMQENLNLALMTLGRGAPTARPGGVAPTAAPRYTVNPATDFRQTVNADYGVKPRIPYDRNPVIDQTFVPREQVRIVNEVQGRPTSSQRLNTESPRQDVRLGEAQTGKRNELSWQNLMDEMRASGEGMPERLARVDMPQVGTSPLVKLAEAKVAGRTLTPAEVGGSESPFLTRPAPGVKRRPVAEAAPAEPAPAPVRETQMAPAEYPVRSQFGVADEPGMMSFQDLERARGAFTGPEMSPLVAQRQRIASQVSAEETRRAAEQQLMAQRQRLSGAIDEASMARPTEGGPLLSPSRGGPTIGAMGPIGAGAAVTALGLGSQSAQDDRARQAAMNAAMERQRIDDLDVANAVRDRAAPQQPFSGTDFFAPSPAPEPFTTTDFFAPSPEQAAPAAGARSSTGIGSDAVNTARHMAAAKAQAPVGGKAIPQPPTRPDSLPRQEPGILSRIFSGKDYQSQGGELRQNGKINWGNPESSADFFRADKARQETPDVAGMARGGAANAAPTKEALLHKSLEIIHHMIRNR